MEYELVNTDPEEIEDLLKKVETSFNIRFVDNELAHITTFGQLCDHIVNKIQLNNVEDCTSQQAFYKLREAISSLFQVDNKTISPDFPLREILPRQARRSRTVMLEKHLGLKLNILRPPHWLTISLAIILLASLIGLFINWQIGLSGLLFSIGGLWFADKVSNELDLTTIGQVAEKVRRENYLKSRRNPNTFNKKEIEKVLVEWFSNDLGIDKSKLSREAAFT